MGRKTKEIVYPHLNDCRGNVDGMWYVEYAVLNKQTGEKLRPRIYEGFDRFTTCEEKRKYADEIIKDLTEKLKSGWRPFEASEIEYEDMLSYHHAATFKGKKTRNKSCIQPLFSEYLLWKKPSVSRSTVDDYRSKLRQFSLYLENENILNRDICYFDHHVTVKFLRYLAENLSRSRKTILKYQQILSDFFTFVREEKHIDVENPVTKNIPRMGKIVDMSAAGVPESIRRILKNEIEKENPQLWMACCFVYYTGKIGENDPPQLEESDPPKLI